MNATATARPVTDKQAAFIGRLLNEREIAHEHVVRLQTRIVNGDLDSRTASKTIEWLLARPMKAGTAAPKPADTGVPAGHYAIVVTDDANDDNPEHDIRFYRVDRPTEGRWAGYTFVKVQSSDEWYRIGRDESKRVLAAIVADVETARMRYANETTRCTRCNRALTDATSRETGMGPDCRGM